MSLLTKVVIPLSTVSSTFHNYIRCPFVVRIRVLVCSLTFSFTIDLHASVLPAGLGYAPLCHGKHQENTTTNVISLLRNADMWCHHSLSPCPGAPPKLPFTEPYTNPENGKDPTKTDGYESRKRERSNEDGEVTKGAHAEKR
jgi:hypothetical protein